MAFAMSLLSTGCTTKVINERPGAASHTTVIEKQPVVTDRQPDVQNNIRIDR